MDLLIPLEEYKELGINRGELTKNKKLDKFILWKTPAGRNMFSIHQIDARLRIAAKFLANKKEILVVCSKLDEKYAKIFGKLISARVINKFSTGMLSNPLYKEYLEPEILLVTNADINKNAIEETKIINIPTIAFCNTNSDISGVDLIVPLNITNKKAIKMALWLIANNIRKLRGEEEVGLEVFGED